MYIWTKQVILCRVASAVVALEGIFLGINHSNREAQCLVRKDMGPWTILIAVATPVPASQHKQTQTLMVSLECWEAFLSLSLCWGLYLSWYFRPNLDSWHQGLSENIWFEGSLRCDGSVTAYLWTKEVVAGRDGWRHRKLYKRSSRT